MRQAKVNWLETYFAARRKGVLTNHNRTHHCELACACTMPALKGLQCHIEALQGTGWLRSAAASLHWRHAADQR